MEKDGKFLINMLRFRYRFFAQNLFGDKSKIVCFFCLFGG